MAKQPNARSSREQVGHTQAQAAELIGVAPRTWQAWELGQNPMPPQMLRLYRHLAGIERIPFHSHTSKGN